jgi:hypothetical protein
VTIIKTDSLDGVVDGVLSQQNNNTKLWHLIAYFLKTMHITELNYNIHNKEILTIILTLEE